MFEIVLTIGTANAAIWTEGAMKTLTGAVILDVPLLFRNLLIVNLTSVLRGEIQVVSNRWKQERLRAQIQH